MEKIKIIKDQGGRYLLPSKSEIYGRFNGYLYPEKFVNDIELPKSFSYGSVQIPFPEKITIRRECNELVAYRHENGEIISIVEYNEKLREYTDKGYYDSGTWNFGNLDDDYHYKKFIRQYYQIHEDKFDEIIFTEFEFIETIVSEYNDITPQVSIVNNIDEMLFVFSPIISEIVTAAAEKIGYTFHEDKIYNSLNDQLKQKTVSIPTHNGYDYMKVNGKYISKEEAIILKRLTSFRGSYAECVKEKERHIDVVYRILKAYDAMLINKKLDTKTIGQMIDMITNIKNRVSNLDVKKNDLSTKNNIVSLINQKINELQQA